MRLMRNIPTLAVVIDSPAFNWRVARQMRKRGIPVVYYVCPQFWAWRQGRVKLLRKYVDKALVIFPFEEKFYRDRGVDATFVGHPLADLPAPAITREVYAAENQLDPAKPWITLMPGSRRKEVRMNLPTILEAADRLEKDRLEKSSLGSGYEFLLPVARTLDAAFLEGLMESAASRISTEEYSSRPRGLAALFSLSCRDRCQRHGYGRSGAHGHSVCDGVSRFAADLRAGQAAGEGCLLRDG